MCGRYSIFTPPETLEDRFGATPERPLEPRYNAAPGQELPVVTNDDPGTIRHLQWGLVPEWADDPGIGNDMINARAETLSEKPSFRAAYERRRCLVLADGFYEWTETDAGKQPYRVTLTGGEPFAMAGLWERWTPETAQTGLGDFDGGTPETDPEPLETFAIVTTEPNDLVADLHHRMSVILPSGEEKRWLAADPDDAADLLVPHPADEMRAYPVSRAVNDPANDSPAVIEEVDAPG
ncbi:DUF159 family protein [Halobacteriales archaeon QS_1_68_17]|nr:MAG: DUF159 family protein [Halobacteriales archaeon QS_1_68_17]